MAGKYVAPFIVDNYKVVFTCPSPDCQTLCPHVVESLSTTDSVTHKIGNEFSRIATTKCTTCGYGMIWRIPFFNNDHAYYSASILFPEQNLLPPCNSDAPSKAKQFYEEAASLYQRSNRACASVARVALESLLQHHYKTEDGLYEILERDNFPAKLYEMAHVVRLVGNDGAHPNVRTIDLDEDVDDILGGMFLFFNSIVKELITNPKDEDNMLQRIKKSLNQEVPSKDAATDDGEKDKTAEVGKS